MRPYPGDLTPVVLALAGALVFMVVISWLFSWYRWRALRLATSGVGSAWITKSDWLSRSSRWQGHCCSPSLARPWRNCRQCKLWTCQH